MSKTRYDWWSYVKGMIRRYPELCAKAQELHTTAMTPSYAGISGGHGGHTDPVADAALRQLPEVNQRELEAVRQALLFTQTLPNGDDRLLMIKLVFWDRSHTVFGAAVKLGHSERTVLRWHGAFIREVAKNFGLLDK